MIRRRIFFIAAILVAACRREAPPAASEPPRTLQTAGVVEREVRTSTEVEGTIVGRSEATVSSRLSATVVEVAAVPGRHVRAGEMLVRLEASEAEGALASARAALSSAREAWEISRGNLERFTRLSQRGAAASVELERAAREEAQARAEVASAGAAVRRAETDRAQALLTAPFEGVVVEKMASPGDLALPGRPLVRLASASGRRVEAAPGEEEASRLTVGEVVDVVLPGQTVSGRVVEIVGSVDRETRRRLIRVELPSGVEPAIGSFARVRLPGTSERRLVAPAAALSERGGLQIAWAIGADGRTELRYVRTGETVGDGSVEIRSGLSAGDRVVLDPPQDLAAGMRVAS
jgi:RND family efflux transporter MFP subunit